MDRNKKSDNLTRKEQNVESKIPKSTKFSSAKDTSSKTTSEKERAQNMKRTVKVDTITSSKEKQTQIANLQKNAKRMSIAKISKDVMNHFETENLNLEDLTSECDARIAVQDKENTAKRAPLKEKYTQTSHKQPGSLPKKPSASCAAFGGIRFTSKKVPCQKVDIFQKMTKETKKDHQAVNPPDPAIAKETEILTKELKASDSAKAVVDKEIERSSDGNLANPSTDEAETSKTTSLTAKQAALKKCTAFGGISFAPKWQSTPLKPDLFDNIQKESKHDDKEVHSTDSSNKWLIDTPDSAKAIVPEKAETVTVDKTVHPPTEEAEYFKTTSIMVKETSDKICAAFAGMRLTPKRKSTHPKPDIFESERREVKADDQELQPSGASAEQLKISSFDTKAITKTEIQRSHVEKLEQFSTQKARSEETVSITMKETTRISAFGGIRLAPKLKSTSVRPNIFDSTQKKSKTGDLEAHPTDSSTEVLKRTPSTSKVIIKAETRPSDFEKLQAPSIEKPESSKIHIEKNVKEIIPKAYPAFGGLRFKPRQKNLRDVFEAQKPKVTNQEQS